MEPKIDSIEYDIITAKSVASFFFELFFEP
jgi:hypothetical protein